MTYSEIMIQAYMEAKGVTKKEAMQHFGVVGLMPSDKKNTEKISSRNAQEILKDLRKDSKGVDAWARRTTE